MRGAIDFYLKCVLAEKEIECDLGVRVWRKRTESKLFQLSVGLDAEGSSVWLWSSLWWEIFIVCDGSQADALEFGGWRICFGRG